MKDFKNKKIEIGDIVRLTHLPPNSRLLLKVAEINLVGKQEHVKLLFPHGKIGLHQYFADNIEKVEIEDLI